MTEALAAVAREPIGPVAASRRSPRRRPWRVDLPATSGLALVLPLLCMIGMFLIYPIVRLVQLALGPPSGTGNFTAFFKETVNLSVLRVTFVNSAIVAVISVLLGAVIAWYICATERRWVRSLLVGAIFVPFWMGSVVKLYAFTVLLERLGIVNRLLLDLHLIGSPLSLIYNQFAVVVGMVYQLLPYSVLPLFVVFRSIDQDS